MNREGPLDDVRELAPSAGDGLEREPENARVELPNVFAAPFERDELATDAGSSGPR